MVEVRLYRKTSHTTFDLKYHLVWITKYQNAHSWGKDSLSHVRELIRRNLRCTGYPNHPVDMYPRITFAFLFQCLPQISVSKIAQYLKGRHQEIAWRKCSTEKFSGAHLWERIFYRSSGSITDRNDYGIHWKSGWRSRLAWGWFYGNWKVGEWVCGKEALIVILNPRL